MLSFSFYRWETEAWSFKHLPDITQLDLTPDALAPEAACHAVPQRSLGWVVIRTPPSHPCPLAGPLHRPAASKQPAGPWEDAASLNPL